MENQSRRGNRMRKLEESQLQARQKNITINTFKEFLNSRLNFQFPEGYDKLSLQKKESLWQAQIQKLLKHKQKICFYLPDKLSVQQVQFSIQMMKKYDSLKLLDYQYESMFLGNNKQLLIYVKCSQMENFLGKYKLNKQYETQIKQVQKIAVLISNMKIQRNIKISLFQKEQLIKLNDQINLLNQKFQKIFQTFSQLFEQMLEHFKSQKNRKIMILSAIRSSIYEKLKLLGSKYQVQIINRFPQTEYDQILDVQVIKIQQNSNYIDPKTLQNQQKKNQYFDSDKSSYVSDLSDDQLQEKKKKLQLKPPIGIHSINFQKYQNKTVYLKLTFEFLNNQQRTPKGIQYSYNNQEFCFKKQINNPKQELIIQFNLKQSGLINCKFRTFNEAGNSNIKIFKYFIDIDKDFSKLKNGNFFMIGQSNVHIPEDKHKKQGNLNKITLATFYFSISSTMVVICDSQGIVADWGLMKNLNQQKNQTIEQNQYFNIFNDKMKLCYNQPAIKLQKTYKIRKVSCGRGYSMYLDRFGDVWVSGNNQYGQLGIKDQKFVQDVKKINLFKQKNIIITDIKATEGAASFCIDSKGQLYKWGANQFFSTDYPIYDRFGCVINYSLQNSLIQQWTPIPVKKHFQKQKIIQIECGNQFYLILNNQYTLYGWGQCRNLGNGTFFDGNDIEIQNICNEIELMKNVSQISAGNDHAIVIKTDGKVIGWGNLNYLSNEKSGFKNQQIDLTDEYGYLSNQDIIKCGPNFTCLYKRNEKKIKIFANQAKFKQKVYEINQQIYKIECSNHLIAFLSK